MGKYNPLEVETKWRRVWEEHQTFTVDISEAKKPFYNLMMFPYPSGEGLHVGHVYAFGGADSFGRFKRMQGLDVFEPMGFDAFGIHSENFAIKKNLHPKDLISQTTTYFREEQLKKLGALFAWDHEVNTTDPNYYQWTQWLFLELYKAKLAIKKEAPVDWCPSCKTVLANEQVVSGHCERCQSAVIQKNLSQWFFKITSYTERLLTNLDKLDWSETTKEMQRNWIGRSEGVEVKFKVQSSKLKVKEEISVFTTRPDTIFGATFMVIAPEHPLVAELLSSKFKVQSSKLDEVKKYVEEAKNKSEVERLATVKEKTGVFTGLQAVNPVNNKEIPIYVADYVLGTYGTGAIMAVPGHDQRDFEFAAKFGLDVIQVIETPTGWDPAKPYPGQGKLINSGKFSSQDSEVAKLNISKYLETNHSGSLKVNYHLRDWLISRQRYWGPPIPVIYCRSCLESAKLKVKSEKLIDGWDFTSIDGVEYKIVPVPEKDLPVLLPDVADYKPLGTGKSPLASVADFVQTTCPDCGSSAMRETDVSDTFLDSSWYFLRFPSVGVQSSKFKVQNGEGTDTEKVAFDTEITKKWLPVDSYIGGNEHAVLHLLYSRFITMVLYDLKKINFEEPFSKFRAHGLIIHQGAKMSKSRGNVINPNEYIAKYGADTLRMYLLFLGPYDQGGDFNVRAIGGVARFLNRVWGLVAGNDIKANNDIKTRHQVVKKVTHDLDNLHFNTAIATLMEYVNHLYKEGVSADDKRILVLLLAPLAPYFAEEAWQQLSSKLKVQSAKLDGFKNEDSVHNQAWPVFDEKELQADSYTLIIQINGRFRDKMEMKPGLSKEEVVRLALDRHAVKKYTESKQIAKTIFVEGKLLNLVLS